MTLISPSSRPSDESPAGTLRRPMQPSSPSAPRTTARIARIVIAGRGDPLVRHLSSALADRYRVVGEVDAELSQSERLLVAASTFRPSRRDWVESFYKSNLAVRLRSGRARRRLADADAYDVVMQTHALFELTDPRTVLYIDCTHRQSIDQWPDWNPLRGMDLQRWLRRERRQYHAAAHLFAFSRETFLSLVDDYGVPADRVSVVGAGVNFDHVPEVVTPAETATPTVLFVGNDFIRKGGEQLLDAFRLVRDRVPDARLQIVGTPHPIAPQPGVEVLGRVNGRDEMTRLYAAASVFVMPSFFDPFPLVILEAMAHGLPVVASPTCGVPEMVVDGSTGLLVPTDERMVERLADALVQLLTDPELAHRMGRNGRERVTERFLWPHVVDRMAPVLERLASVAR